MNTNESGTSSFGHHTAKSISALLAIFFIIALFSATTVLAAPGEGAALINGSAGVTLPISYTNTYTIALTVGAAGIAIDADSPTFAIPAGFTAPDATEEVAVEDVDAAGEWFAVGAGGTCAVTMGGAGTSATGQVMTLDVTGACAWNDTITLTYRGTSAGTGSAPTALIITTDDASGGGAGSAIASPPTMGVYGTGVIAAHATAGVATTNNLAGKAKIGATDVVLSGFKLTAAGENNAITTFRTTVTLGTMVIGELTNLRIVPDGGAGAGDPDDGIMHAAELAAPLQTIASPVEGVNNFVFGASIVPVGTTNYFLVGTIASTVSDGDTLDVEATGAGTVSQGATSGLAIIVTGTSANDLRTITDTTAPTFTANTTTTTTITITFSENVNSAADDKADWAVAGNTIASISALDGSGNTMTITLDTPIAGNAVPDVTYTADDGDIVDVSAALNALATATVTPTDGIAPTLTAKETGDVDADGKLDNIKLTFSENIDKSDFTDNSASGWVVAGYTVVEACSAADCADANINNDADGNTVYLQLTELATADTSATPTVNYTIGTISDANGIGLANIVAAAATDQAGPAIFTARSLTTTTVEVNFSEAVSDASVVVADVTFNFADVAADGIASALASGTANDKTIVFTILAGAIGVGEATGTVALSGAGVVTDGNAVVSTQTATVTVSDSIAPTLTAKETGDADSDGKIDNIKLTFSENIDKSDFTNDAASGWAVTGYTVVEACSAANCADTDITDDADGTIVYLQLTELASADSSATPNVGYTAGTISDANGVALATIGAAASSDKAGPAIITARSLSTTLVNVTFSESVSDASIVAGDITFNFASGAADGAASLFTTAVANDDWGVFTIAGGAIGVSETTGTAAITGAGNIADAAANTNTQTGTITVADGIAPTFTAATATTTTITVTFSENVNSAADDGADWAVSGNTVSSISTLDGSGNTLTVTVGTAMATNATPTVTYNATAGDIVDSSSNALATATVTTTDGIKPTFTATRTALNTIVLTFTEDVDAAVNETLAWTVAGGTVTYVTDPANTLTLTITTTGLTNASSSPAVTYVAGSGTVADAAANEVANGASANAGDQVPPTFTAARTALNTIVLTFSENVDAAVNETSAWTVAGGTVTYVTDPAMSTSLTITTTGLTATDGTPAVTYNATAGTVVDVAANEVANGATANAADQVKPTVTSATLNYGTGVLVATFSETIDASATDATKFHLNNITGTDDVSLTVAPTDTDATTLSFTLTNAQRVAAMALSGTTGGDGGAVVLDVDPLGVTDMASNTNLIDDNNTVTETADTVKPTVTSATLNYGTGVLVVTFSETVNAGLANATLFHINNAEGTDLVNLTAAPADVDATTLTFTLTEAQRVAALLISGTTGGDAGAVVLDVDPLAVTDMASNTNLIDDNNVVTETADSVKPTVTSATLNYTTGVLVVLFSETIDASATAAGEFHLNNVTTSDDVTLSAAPTDTDATTLTFTLTEAQRAAAVALSNTTGGDGSPIVLDVDALGVTDLASNTNIADDNNAVTEAADISKPTVTSATLNYGTGVLVVTFSETVNAGVADATKFHLNNITGTDNVNLTAAPTDTDAVTLSFTLTEAQRIAALARSGTTGGDGGAVVLDVDALGVTDMSSNTNLIDDNNTVTETADTVKLTVTSATLNYSTGALVVLFSETIDASATVASKFHINDITGSDNVTLSVAPTNTDATTLTFTLTEAQRYAALLFSGTPGGDAGAVVLDVDAAAVADMATATNLIDDNNTVTETADSLAPSVSSVTYSANPANSVDDVTVTVVMSEQVTDAPKIAINQQGTTDIAATNMTGSTPGATFTYAYNVNMANGGTYVDGAAFVGVSLAEDVGLNSMTLVPANGSSPYNFTIATISAFEFPKGGNGFRTLPKYGDLISTSELSDTTIWLSSLKMSTFLNSSSAQADQRLTSADVNNVYVYNSASGWVTVAAADFATWNVYTGFASLNYVVLDLKQDAYGKSIRHAEN